MPNLLSDTRTTGRTSQVVNLNFISLALRQNECINRNMNMSWDKEVAATSLMVCVVVAVPTNKALNSDPNVKCRLLAHSQAP